MSPTGKLQQLKKASRRNFLQGAALAGGGLLLAACAPKAEEKVVKETVVVEKEKVVKETVVSQPTEAPKEAVTIKMFNPMDPAVYSPFGVDLVKERYPQATLELVYLQGSGWDGTCDKLITMIAGGEGVDIIGMATEGIGIMATKKTLRPLQPFMDADPAAAEDFNKDMHPTLMQGMTWQGELLLLPYGWNNMIIHYNYKIFEQLGIPEPEEGWNWDDFVSVCRELSDVKGAETDRYAYSFWGSGAFGMAPWFFNNDTSWLKNNWSDSNMDDPKVAETLQYLADLILKYRVSPNPTGWDEYGNFHAGHLVMRSCGGWCTGAARAAEFYDYKFQYQPHKAGKLKTVIGMGGYAVATMSAHPQDAWEVIKVILSPEGQLQYTTVDGSPPARRSVAESAAFMDKAKPSPADMSIFYASLDYADVVPAPANFNLIEPLLNRYYSQIWNGEITVEAAVKAAHEELQAEMDLLKKA